MRLKVSLSAHNLVAAPPRWDARSPCS